MPDNEPTDQPTSDEPAEPDEPDEANEPDPPTNDEPDEATIADAVAEMVGFTVDPRPLDELTGDELAERILDRG